MNKFYLFILLGFFGHVSFSQQWVDSIMLARKAYKSKDYSTADRIYTSHYKKSKSKGGIDEELAQTKYRQRDFKGAIHYYEKKLKSAKSTQEKARIHHNLGNSYFEKGDYKQAIDSYKSSLRLNPSDQKTRYNLSEALKSQQSRQNKPENKKDKTNRKNPNPSKKSPNNSPKNQSNQTNNKKSANPQDTQPSKGSLPKKDVERKLDELSRKEGETRRKMSKGNRTKGATNSSKKDW